MRLVRRCVVEAIDRYHKWNFSAFAEVYRRKTTFQPSGVRENNRAQRLVSEFIPHEPKTLLTWSPEEVKDRSGLIVMRPKSRATVVVVLSLIPARSSTPELSSLSTPTPPDDARGDTQTRGRDVEPTAVEEAPVTSLRPAPLVTQVALLLSIFLGGWVAAVAAGRFEFRFDMGNGFRDLVTDNPTTMIGVLFVGGVLVGFGTRLAGGCSSGHGLSGCGRLRPVSIVATAVFFGAAVLVSFLLWKAI